MAAAGVVASSGAGAFPAATCDCEVFDKLEHLVASPSFLKALELSSTKQKLAPTGGVGATSSERPVPAPSTSHHVLPGGDTVDSAGLGMSSTWERECMDEAYLEQQQQQEFVMVDKEDAVQAMAYYLAQCIIAHPEAQDMTPQKLQLAVSSALKGLKQSRFKQLCTFGRHAYRWGALSYSALQMYQNPWLVQVVLSSLWTLSRIGMRMLA